jgi:hypothetical protein
VPALARLAGVSRHDEVPDEVYLRQMRQLQTRIAQLVMELDACYDQRAALLQQLASTGMSQRAVGEIWSMTQPAVLYALRRGQGIRTRRPAYRRD